MLTSADETDLLIPLHDSTLDGRRFPAFLERLRQRLRAAHAGLLIRKADGPEERMSAGLDLSREAISRGFAESTVTGRLPFERMRPGRVYSAGEFIDAGGELRDSYSAHLGAIGIVDERMVRVAAEPGSDGWLVVSRGEPCPASDSAILSALVPHLAVALRGHAAQQRERLAAGIANAGLERAATGTISFDREGQLLAIAPAVAAWLRRATGRDPRAGQRLAGLDAEVQRRLVAAAARFGRDPGARDEALCLHAEARIEAVLVPGAALAGAAGPAMVALCRVPPPRSHRRADAFAQLHDLPPREAELALRVSEGRSIAEAAEEMGLTVETARNYSKQLYARLGVRGQAELAALVCTGGAMLG